MKNSWLIKSGFLVPVIFWTTTLICGFILTDYNHSSRMVSELGENRNRKLNTYLHLG